MTPKKAKKEESVSQTVGRIGSTIRTSWPPLALALIIGAWWAVLHPGFGRVLGIAASVSTPLGAVWLLLGGPDAAAFRRVSGAIVRSRPVRVLSIVGLVCFAIGSGFITTVTFVSDDSGAKPELLALPDAHADVDSTTLPAWMLQLDAEHPKRTVFVRTRPWGRPFAFRVASLTRVLHKAQWPWLPATIHYPSDFPETLVAVGLVMPRVDSTKKRLLTVRVYAVGVDAAPIAQDTITGPPFALLVSSARPAPPDTTDSLSWLAAMGTAGVQDAKNHPLLVNLWMRRWRWISSRRELQRNEQLRIVLHFPNDSVAAQQQLTLDGTTSNALIRKYVPPDAPR